VAQRLGTRLIIAYKAAKAVLQATTALVVLASHGVVPRALLLQLGAWLVEHGTRPWQAALADWVRRAARPRAIAVIAIVLLADAALSALEAWALRRGREWGPWLVVIATATLLPFEVAGLLHRPDVARATLLAINLAVVAYLARQIRVTAPATV
jgi:uncharacterized membrane protein (DUF2068 family)